MGVTLKPIVYVLRGGENHEKHGDPWEFVASVQRIGDVAYIEGGRGELPPIAEIRQILRREGFTQAKWERIENGVKKTVLLRL